MANEPLPVTRAMPGSEGHGGRRSTPGGMLILVLLTLSYTVSFMDRTALGVLQERLKYDLGLSDWQLGMMSGPAFALLYAISGLPLARLAERLHRGRILAACLVIWSAMTMACGLARSFAELFLARMGVGIGEAGGNPVAHSLIADTFPPARRARAIAIYSLGAPVGAFLGAALVGQLAQSYSWRTVFFLLGPPGIVLALLVLWLLPEVKRTRGAVPADPGPSFVEVLRELIAQPAFRHLSAGAALVVLVGYGVASFIAPFLLRQHHLPIAQVGLLAGLVNGLAAGVGTLAGGQLGDRLARRDRRWLVLIPALAAATGMPLLMVGWLSPGMTLALAGLLFGTLCIYGYIAPAFAAVYDLSPPQSRATSTAVFYLIINLVGTGLGPPLIGFLSDALAKQHYRASQAATAFEIACHGPHMPAPCTAAVATGLSEALAWITILLLPAALHFWLASRHFAGARAAEELPAG